MQCSPRSALTVMALTIGARLRPPFLMVVMATPFMESHAQREGRDNRRSAVVKYGVSAVCLGRLSGPSLARGRPLLFDAEQAFGVSSSA